MPAILLVGFMCSGKTTLGEALARRLSISFTDLDAAIESRHGMSVRDIFKTEGEKAFRQMEVETLSEVLRDNPDGVIALGGGTPCSPGVMEMLNRIGVTVWLRADFDRLIPRLMLGRRSRPLLQDIDTAEEMKDFVVGRLAKRDPYYSQARYQFDSSLLESESEIQASIDRFIKNIIPDKNR